MNELLQYFNNNQGRLIFKWMHYFDIYDRHFSRFRNQEIVILEIGVFQGGSLQMWKHYFGNKAKIYAIDINPECKKVEEENIKIFIGSQSDRKFLNEIKKIIPPIDILIDDGGHSMEQQKVSFEELFSHIKDNGIYFIEDLHTSYWIQYGGGYKRKGTFIEYSKNFIDFLNAYHSEQKTLAINDFTKSVESIHYYDSVLVVEKNKRKRPYTQKSGFQSFSSVENTTSANQYQKKVTGFILRSVNKFLRFWRLPGFIWK